jgi:hypothetical protein
MHLKITPDAKSLSVRLDFAKFFKTNYIMLWYFDLHLQLFFF